ncbi:hypothetical protein B0T16DRAFT_115148 [Cercophora newfieldiana]|uniref:DUF7907 domain-containing protein n=1 Tax=Cercophora newfieldiana TaxID=92897 RepID=A0AA39Y992_9PEZI|nr:hypothetical protein B0T16DRAFT_115148 [Cercophora newfieldiana]
MLAAALFALAGLAAAAPIDDPPCPGCWVPGNYPPTTSGAGIRLVANLSDPTSKIFDPPVQHWYLGSVHGGAGINDAILTPTTQYSHTFFVNGTGPEISGMATNVLLPPFESSNGPIPMGLVYKPGQDRGYLQVNIGEGTRSFGIVHGMRSRYPLLFHPFQYSSEFMVCKVEHPAVTRPDYPVFAYQGTLPDNCAKFHFLPECAPLGDLIGVEELHLKHVDSSCYESVKALDWTTSDPVYWSDLTSLN